MRRFLCTSLVIILLLDSCVNGVEIFRRKRNRNRHAHPSPLDMENSEDEHHGEFAGGFIPLNPEALIPDQIAMDRLPECQHACNTAFNNAMKVALQAGNHHERFLGVCRHFNESLTCHDELIACPGRDAFDVLTSGLYYMCIEQRAAFDKVIECLDVKSNEVQKECENQCRGQNRLSDWASKSGLFNLFSRSEKTLSNFEPENFRLMMHDLCELASCYLTCIRNSYNNKCGDNAGTLLSEAIVRPVAETQADPYFKSMSTFMYVFVPQQCSFFVKEDALATHRIDPQTDMELKRRAEEERMNATGITKDLPTTTSTINATVNPITQQEIQQTTQPPLNQNPQPIQQQSENPTQTRTQQQEMPINNQDQSNPPTQQASQDVSQFSPNRVAIVGDMTDFDPIDIGEKWGFDIGMQPENFNK